MSHMDGHFLAPRNLVQCGLVGLLAVEFGYAMPNWFSPKEVEDTLSDTMKKINGYMPFVILGTLCLYSFAVVWQRHFEKKIAATTTTTSSKQE
ncbi:MAG: hypothetical protein HZB76_01905 [Chlamydiae bacterium]|nr:hypothetical protein [Chlamydiota bacterium]